MKAEAVNQSRFRMPKAMIDRWISRCEKELSKQDQRRLKGLKILVVYVSRSQMKKINFQFRNRNEPTDILSFESVDPESLGELVLSPEVVKAQAKRTGLSFHQELCYMVLHGLLHLLGYDHETSLKEAKIMFALQNRIFQKLAPRFDFR